MSERSSAQIASDKSDRSDSTEFKRKFLSDLGVAVSDRSAAPSDAGRSVRPRPTAVRPGRTGKGEQNQWCPTCPTCPTGKGSNQIAKPPRRRPTLEQIEAFEERAAIREFDGGESRERAEAAAAIEIGMPPRDVPSGDEKPVDQSDCEALLAELREHGPLTPGAAAEQMKWGATRASRAVSSLKRQGRVRLGSLGEAVPVVEGSE
ncbi:MAG: hypothetical protein AAFY66_10070 [Pseudomonadota bacterium]